MKPNEEKITDFEGEETLSITSADKGDVFEDGEEVYPDAILNISRETASVFQLKRRWEKEPSMLDLTPSFQRELVWKVKQKSELIESIIMGIPLPAFYVKENEEGVYIVVDGKQRLSTLFYYINGEFKLEGLSVLKNYNGKYFSDLSPIEQNKLEDYTLNINVIKSPTSDRVMFDLFDRVNRGGTILNNQEMRNALYQGRATELIDELSKNENFLEATEHSIPPKHMKDRYMVLRFLAFYMCNEHISVDTDTETREKLLYKSNMEDFLGKTMRFLNDEEDADFFNGLIKVFDNCMSLAAKHVVPLGGFRLPSVKEQHKRSINMVFFESFCYLITKLKSNEEGLIKVMYSSLLKDEEYVKSLTYSIDSRKQTHLRYKRIDYYINKKRDNADKIQYKEL